MTVVYALLAKQHRRLHSSYMDLPSQTQISGSPYSCYLLYNVNTQFHTSIKVVRSDNGSEFVNAQSRASKCIFLGYSQSQKAYKVYSLDSNTLFTSRDVVFHEHTFPFQAVSIDSDPVSIPLPIVDSDVHTPTPDPPIPFSNSLHPFPVTQPVVPTSSDTHIPLRRSQRTNWNKFGSGSRNLGDLG
ncbi:hypothetical protein Sango_1860200 [Sesamum angolense]|uniref:Retroviral polymerase SH3-like domain-containing protein n=1 Tax=Sesamum angolense TaxID=2727404 RepID=A0AAE1WID2_9LAMI|nr:hypothetical protein Sango_1860200 [Sesamum angolense]